MEQSQWNRWEEVIDRLGAVFAGFIGALMGRSLTLPPIAAGIYLLGGVIALRFVWGTSVRKGEMLGTAGAFILGFASA